MYKNTIPVQIDRIIDTRQYHIVRCAFFRIESTGKPLALTESPLLSGGVSLTVWGEWALLAGPLDSQGALGAFGDLPALESALERIQDEEELLTDLGYLWLPLDLLRDCGEHVPAKGDVYRISMPLFTYGYSRTLSGDSVDAWGDWEAPKECLVFHSADESGVFRAWRRRQIERSRELSDFAELAPRRIGREGRL